ncbi:hypothetical protein OC846_006764, partial [Tilletia horrida]
PYEISEDDEDGQRDDGKEGEATCAACKEATGSSSSRSLVEDAQSGSKKRPRSVTVPDPKGKGKGVPPVVRYVTIPKKLKKVDGKPKV